MVPAGNVLAIDLGATSGRVAIARIDNGRVESRTLVRFENDPVRMAGRLVWDSPALWRGVVSGLAEAARLSVPIDSIGFDSWGVDYGLVRGESLIGLPVHYRDDRNERGEARVLGGVSKEWLFERNGLQHMAINTVFQLAAEDSAMLEIAESLLLIPDLFNFWSSGAIATERTIASTTGLLNVLDGDWDPELIRLTGARPRLFPAIVDPGTRLGSIRTDVAEHTGLDRRTEVVAIGSHDTASAIAATPMDPSRGVYISCGTWGLVGVEMTTPCMSAESRALGFTNERGVGDRFRVLKNVMGLWLLSESIRWWGRDGQRLAIEEAMRLALSAKTTTPPFDVDSPELAIPGDVPGRISAWYVARGLRPPADRPEMIRCIIESIAHALARAAAQASALAVMDDYTVHVVGGGSRNALLCQLIADLSGKNVVAGPAEATSLGNALLQLSGRRHGSDQVDWIRGTVARSMDLVTYTPARRPT